VSASCGLLLVVTCCQILSDSEQVEVVTVAVLEVGRQVLGEGMLLTAWLQLQLSDCHVGIQAVLVLPPSM
jgi:hypothetical protein